MYDIYVYKMYMCICVYICVYMCVCLTLCIYKA